MSVGFSSDVAFGVVPDDEGRVVLPVPSTDDDSQTWDATVILANQAAYDALAAYVSGVAMQPAMGGGGIAVVTRGRGARTLTLPTANGTTKAYTAILTTLSGRPRILADDHLSCDVSFLVLGPAT